MAGAGGNMMVGALTSGSADSGCGVVIAGFFCPTHEFPMKLAELMKDFNDPNLRIAQCESNGYITFLASQKGIPSPVKTTAATLRREPSKLFSDLGLFLKKLRACYIDQMALSESYGNITLTILYRAESEGETSA